VLGDNHHYTPFVWLTITSGGTEPFRAASNFLYTHISTPRWRQIYFEPFRNVFSPTHNPRSSHPC
jgi:hypothetical protein